MCAWRGWASRPPRTPCDTVSPPTSCSTAPTSDRCRRCSVMPTSQPPRSTPTSPTPSCEPSTATSTAAIAAGPPGSSPPLPALALGRGYLADLLQAHLGEAVVAVHRPRLAGLERHLGRLPTIGAHHVEHASGPLPLLPLGRATLRTPLRLVEQAFLLEKALLTRRPDEVGGAITTP